MEDLISANSIGMIPTRQYSSEINASFFKSNAYRNWLEFKANFYNEQPGSLRFYDCPKCKNKGVIEYITEDLEESMKDCECMIMRACYMAMAQSGITEEAINRMTFDSFHDAENEWQTRMKAIAKRYSESDLTHWLLMSGMSGTGKTHLCTAVSKHLMQKGHVVKYVMWHDAVRKLSSFKYKIEEYEKYMKDIINAEVLYIDDMFKSDKAEKGIAFEIINTRYINRKPTIISTELNLQAIEEIDAAISGRIEEMTRGFCAQIKEAPDRNQRKRM